MPIRKPQPKPAARRAPAERGPPSTEAPPVAPATRYRVLSGGISAAAGPAWNGAIVSAEQLGDADRVQKLLDKGSIEVVNDAESET